MTVQKYQNLLLSKIIFIPIANPLTPNSYSTY
jgi:hypothetical protein